MITTHFVHHVRYKSYRLSSLSNEYVLATIHDKLKYIRSAYERLKCFLDVLCSEKNTPLDNSFFLTLWHNYLLQLLSISERRFRVFLNVRLRQPPITNKTFSTSRVKDEHTQTAVIMSVPRPWPLRWWHDKIGIVTARFSKYGIFFFSVMHPATSHYDP